MLWSNPLHGGMTPLVAIWARAMVMSFLKRGRATVMGRAFIDEWEL